MASTIQSTATLRKNLLAKMSDPKEGKAFSKVIQFRNNDVPQFIASLNTFEQASSRVKHRVG